MIPRFALSLFFLSCSVIAQTQYPDCFETLDTFREFNDSPIEFVTTLTIEKIQTEQIKAVCSDTQIQNSTQNALTPVTIIPPATISQPGTYCVVDDLTIPSFQNGIIINANNVILDLNNHIIQGQTNSLSAIVVSNNNKNITIQNGTIQTMGGHGILINAGTSLIVLSNLTILNNRLNGILLSGAISGVIINCLTSFNGNDGILLGQIGQALSINQNFAIQNCVSSYNTQNGFEMTSCVNFAITDCLALNNGAYGFRQENGNRIRFNGCEAQNNHTVGFFSSGKSHSFNECLANNNGTIGFQISGNQQTIENCQAKINKTGFEINGSNHVLFNCIAQNNSSTGISLLSGSAQCQIRDNTTIANSTGLQNNTTTVNQIYSNFSSANTTANFLGVPAANIATSPTAATAINFTANIEN
jgi:Right handed beta helix region